MAESKTESQDDAEPFARPAPEPLLQPIGARAPAREPGQRPGPSRVAQAGAAAMALPPGGLARGWVVVAPGGCRRRPGRPWLAWLRPCGRAAGCFSQAVSLGQRGLRARPVGPWASHGNLLECLPIPRALAWPSPGTRPIPSPCWPPWPGGGALALAPGP
jgi:hypothetical protein